MLFSNCWLYPKLYYNSLTWINLQIYIIRVNWNTSYIVPLILTWAICIVIMINNEQSPAKHYYRYPCFIFIKRLGA
jgi:hypothetical protein